MFRYKSALHYGLCLSSVLKSFVHTVLVRPIGCLALYLPYLTPLSLHWFSGSLDILGCLLPEGTFCSDCLKISPHLFRTDSIDSTVRDLPSSCDSHC